MQSSGAARRSMRSAVTKPVPAALVLLVAYIALSFLMSPDGYLGTDTGAKVVTLDAMVENRTVRPDVGYWAADWDPDGEFHPLLDTHANDDGEWVNVTTLPMLIGAYPLYALGGYRLALLWPMFGGVLAAFACRDVVRQLAGEREAWTAFWVTGLASPIAIYALDLWEHALGAGLMVLAFALLLRVVRGATAWWLPALAGAALGASATMRTESFVAALVFVGGTSIVLLLRGRVTMALGSGALAVGGFAVPWLLNSLLEASLGGNSRASRVGGASSREWWTELTLRSKEALITWFGLPNADYPANVLLGALVVGSFTGAGLFARRQEERAALLALGAGMTCYVLSLAAGLAFVSGALVAAPVAAAVLILPHWDGDRLFIGAAALATTVITWMFQYTGGARPQWGGRYLLAPTLLLLCLGVIALHSSPAVIRRGFLTSAFAVTVFGLLWLQTRSHDVGTFFEELADRPEDVVISTNGFLVREAGPMYDERMYLSVGRGGDLEGAVDVVRRSGRDTFAVLTSAHEPPELDAEYVGSDTPELLGVELSYHRYTFAGASRSTDE